MAANIKLWDVVCRNAPAIIVPTLEGGTAQFDDTSDADATSADILAPKTAYVNGQKVVGTGTGGGGTANLQDKTNINPSTSSQTIRADTGYDGLSSVQINAMPSMTLPTSAAASATSGYSSKATIGRSTSDQYINIPTGYNAAGAYYKVSAVANGTAGTPTATKGTVSNHSISVTPSVTNQTGYITGSTKTGTAVTVSASELASGNKEITANGTNIDVVGYSTVSVSVPGGGGDSKNAQIAQGFGRVAATAYTAVSGQSIKVAKTGSYDVYWTAWRTSTSGTSGTCLYVDSSAHTSGNQTTWDATYTNVQSIHLTGVSLTKDQTIAVRARSRNTSYYTYVFNLTIIEV